MRMYGLTRATFAAVVGMFCVAPDVTFGQSRSYTVMPVFAPEGGESFARGLNNLGHVAGRAGSIWGTNTVPFVWKDGKLDSILAGAIADVYAGAYGINEAGDVVGSGNTGTALVPFLWTAQGTRVPLPLPTGDNGGQALAINNSGDVVGYTSGPRGMRAVLWQRNRSVRLLSTNDDSRAFDINDSGEVAGTVTKAGVHQAGVWSRGGVLTIIGTLPGDISSEALGINNLGDVVGWSTAARGNSRAFIWNRKEGMKPLGFLPGGDHSRALDINDSREVVGTSTSSLGERAFVWTSQDGMKDLNVLIPFTSGVHFVEAQAINRRGQIVAFAIDGLGNHDDEGPTLLFLATPGGVAPL